MLSLFISRASFGRCAVFAAMLIAACVTGCPSGEEEPAEPRAQPIPTVRILVIDDQPLADAIKQEWVAAGRGDLQVRVASLESLSQAKRLAADCIVYPSGLLGELAQRQLIVPVPNETLASETLNRGDFFPLVRMRETAWGKNIYAVPLGSPSIVLLYRQDLLDELDRQPPQTWVQYQELLDLLEQSDSVEANGHAEWQPAIEPLAGDAAAEMLLARAVGYARHPQSISVLIDYQTMEPLITQPPFVRALREMVDASAAHPEMLAATHVDAREALLTGKCAMALTWPSNNSPEYAKELPIACAPLPGADAVYNSQSNEWEPATPSSQATLLGVSGRLASITSSARHTGAAAAALKWLASADVSRAISLPNPACSLCRGTQVSQGDDWVAKEYGDAGQQYAAVLEEEKSRRLWCFSPRIPGRARYLEALSDAVRAAVAGEKSPETALADAADRWREITADFGSDAQRDAYAHSLGID